MAAAAILKNRNIAISPKRMDQFWRNLARWCICLSGSNQPKNRNFKNPTWWWLPSWQESQL